RAWIASRVTGAMKPTRLAGVVGTLAAAIACAAPVRLPPAESLERVSVLDRKGVLVRDLTADQARWLHAAVAGCSWHQDFATFPMPDFYFAFRTRTSETQLFLKNDTLYGTGADGNHVWCELGSTRGFTLQQLTSG